MDDETEHYKSVYAEFGLAIYLAQCLEHGLVNALIYIDLIPNRSRAAESLEEWGALFDSYISDRFSLTLGRLIGELKKITDVEQGLSDRLKAALSSRNFLAHHFFRERAELFLSEAGRNSMLEELAEAQELFQSVETQLAEAVRPAKERIGLTQERLRAYYAEWAQASGLEL